MLHERMKSQSERLSSFIEEEYKGEDFYEKLFVKKTRVDELQTQIQTETKNLTV